VVFESASSVIIVHFVGFIPSFPNMLKCRFEGQKVVDSLFVNESAIQCNAPISVEVAMNGVDFMEAGSIQVVASPETLSISPSEGSWVGHTKVT
jgi:hypothetical protein